MKRVLWLFPILLFYFPVLAQTSVVPKAKATIDTSVFNRWPSVDVPLISSDAKYAFFTIKTPFSLKTTVLRSMNTTWRKEFISAKSAVFSTDNTNAIIMNSGDSLCIITLRSDEIEFIPSVSSFKLIRQKSNEWLCYQKKKSNDFIIRNLKSKEQSIYRGIVSYLFNIEATVLILLKKSESAQTISWISFPEGKSTDVWEGSNASDLAFDKLGRRLAFIATNGLDKSIWLFKAGEEKASMIANNQSKGIDNSLVIDGLNYRTVFTGDGKRLFLSLKEKPTLKKPSGVMVDVWAYTDELLQELQLKNPVGTNKYTAVLDLSSGTIARLQIQDDNIYMISDENTDRTIVWGGNIPENPWNAKSMAYSSSTVDGTRAGIEIAGRTIISPTEKYLVGWKRNDMSDIYSFNLNTGEIKNITTDIAGAYDKVYDEVPFSSHNKYLRSLIWLKDESYVLIHDRYDIWMADPTAKQTPINLTNNYGKNNHIMFRLPDIYKDSYRPKTLMKGEKVILSGFNRATKEEGFYEIEIGKSSNPKLLTKGAYQFEISKTSYNIVQLEIKAKRNFLIRRESATESPNYFLTSDFKTFRPVTDVYPERSYNWLTAELHSWTGLDGSNLQGILYKPENFAPEKKYPVVVHYYENMSDKLNQYHYPYFMEGEINIPFFVSQGYLVFTPDIPSVPGKDGESALSSVVSAANYLSNFSFIDAKHIGIQGHSFGGYETNYITTHSNLFAAAMSASGPSDLISHYGSLADGRSSMTYYETGQQRMGKSLWEDPKAYIEGSPILSAHIVTTPLLLMANKKDDWNYGQQMELFLGLRRLGKRAWLLQYDNGGHRVSGKESEDLTVRILQFFDHYLKDSACPKWMLKGISAKKKGFDSGLELVKEKDKRGNWVTPMEGGLLTNEEKKKMEKLKQVKPISITLN